MPVAKDVPSPRFGMLTDRFGVGRMVQVVAGVTNEDRRKP
jgi:hypothetical protein